MDIIIASGFCGLASTSATPVRPGLIRTRCTYAGTIVVFQTYWRPLLCCCLLSVIAFVNVPKCSPFEVPIQCCAHQYTVLDVIARWLCGVTDLPDSSM